MDISEGGSDIEVIELTGQQRQLLGLEDNASAHFIAIDGEIQIIHGEGDVAVIAPTVGAAGVAAVTTKAGAAATAAVAACTASGVCIATVALGAGTVATYVYLNSDDGENIAKSKDQGFDPEEAKPIILSTPANDEYGPNVESFPIDEGTDDTLVTLPPDESIVSQDEGFDWLPDWLTGPDVLFSDAMDDTPKSIVIGHYPEYVEVAGETKAKVFEIPLSVWSDMTLEEQWEANTKFLDRAISRGSDIILATPPENARKGSFYEKEIQYLEDKGYKISDDSELMIKD